jgi:retron-type reverse transcriptase
VTIGQTNERGKVDGLITIFVKEIEERMERGIRIEWMNERDREVLEKKGKEIKYENV